MSKEEKEIIVDEYGFSFDAALLPEYQAFLTKHTERKAAVLHKNAVNILTPTKKLKSYVESGVLPEQRPMLWMLTSGAMKKKESHNTNCETGTYYSNLVETNKRHIEANKPLDSFHEVEKDITRTFPGHKETESPEGQEKLKTLLMAYARRNKQVGYCQSMNFIAAFALLFLEEEDAFWLLTTIVEDILPGIWSRTMMNIQVDSLVLAELVKEKLPEIHKHFEKIRMSLLLITTKWYMCLFIGNLPTESTLRVWDYLLAQGSPFMFKFSLAILHHLQSDLFRAKDPMHCCKIIQQNTKKIFDIKPLLKQMYKWSDVDKDKVEELRHKHLAGLNTSGISSEQIEALREQMKSGWSGNTANGVAQSLSSTYKVFAGNISSWYKNKKGDYNNYVAKQQVANAKLRNASVFEIEAGTQAQMQEFALQSSMPIDFVVEGIAVRLYSDGKKYQGHFNNNKREGYGTVFYKDGRIEYDGFWKMDKKHGEGTLNDLENEITYKGQWKNDEYHGHGYLKMKDFSYEGDWKHGKQEGKGILILTSGGKYDGEWKNDQWEGKGTMNFFNGDKYDGDWKASAQDGKGTMVYANGDRYEGHWKSTRQNGRGTMYFVSGDKYEGEWKNDKIEGKGIMTYSNGDKYEGEWKQDKREGHGICHFADGSIYDGDWKSNRQTGRGVITYPQLNTKYDGEFVSGRKQGRGKFFMANGDVVEGEWKNDEIDGVSLLTSSPATGSIKTSVEYREGYLVDGGVLTNNKLETGIPETNGVEIRKSRRLSIGNNSGMRTSQSASSSSPLISPPNISPRKKEEEEAKANSSKDSAAATIDSKKEEEEKNRVGSSLKFMANKHMSAIERIRAKNMGSKE